MQDYIEIASKNGVVLVNQGTCQFCGAQTSRGIEECVEIFNLSFQGIDFSEPRNHIFRFLIVDAHTLQHPEIHGRWNNHFHLTRLHLILHHNVAWSYKQSPRLSDHLNRYKKQHSDEFLAPPEILKRGRITSSDIVKVSNNEIECKAQIKNWAKEVYVAWKNHHDVVEEIALGYLKSL